MRVLHWCPNFSSAGAVGRTVSRLASHQTRLGVEVVIATKIPLGELTYEPVQPQGPVQQIQWRATRSISIGKRGSLDFVDRTHVETFKRLSPDIVHVHGEFNPNNWWPPRLFRCPIVLSVHGAFHPQLLRRSGKTSRWIYIQLAKRALYGFVSWFHALSPMEADHIRALLPGVRIYCVPQGPGFSIPEHSPFDSSVKDGSIRLVYVGRLDVRAKGLDILLEALALVKGHLPARVELTLVGPDWNGGRAWLLRKAEALRVAEQVVIEDTLPSAAIAALVGRSDLYIQLSRNDSFPLSVAEALYMGKPAILSRSIGITSYPEVNTFPHVMVVSPDSAEAARAIAGFAGRLDEIGRAGQAHLGNVRAFLSWERSARLHVDMYRQMLAANSRRTPHT